LIYLIINLNLFYQYKHEPLIHIRFPYFFLFLYYLYCWNYLNFVHLLGVWGLDMIRKTFFTENKLTVGTLLFFTFFINLFLRVNGTILMHLLIKPKIFHFFFFQIDIYIFLSQNIIFKFYFMKMFFLSFCIFSFHALLIRSLLFY